LRVLVATVASLVASVPLAAMVPGINTNGEENE
jgi:hypothetical protein